MLSIYFVLFFKKSNVYNLNFDTLYTHKRLKRKSKDQLEYYQKASARECQFQDRNWRVWNLIW